MASISEILNRDPRTTRSIIKNDKNADCISSLSDINDFQSFCNCDKCQNKYQPTTGSNFKNKLTNFKMKKFSNYTLIIAITIYIMSSNSTQANPIHKRSGGHDTVDRKVNFMNLQCNTVSEKRVLATTPLSDEVLKERLKAVLHNCRSALTKTKTLTDDYVNALWGQQTSVMAHHETWEAKSIPWLHPNNKPLEHKFRGEIEEKHKAELERTNWTYDKILEYLGKIYQRFQRIGIGVQIVNEWNSLATNTTMLTVNERNNSTRLFKTATEGIHEVLCQIEGIFYDMAINPKTDLDITPFVLDKFIKLNHWLVYREYENLMDYSQKLLKHITLK